MAEANNPYLELTEELNQGRLRALLSSGQAVVVHRLAIMSKDGDWLLREDAEAATHAPQVLSRRGTWYRFGAPLDLRWLANGWSAHLELRRGPLRLRTDFVTRPPRITADWLQRIWETAQASGTEVVGLEPATRSVSGPHDEFLSEEDLDLRNLSDDELVAYWNLWLEQAQGTNSLDAHLYSHGVFEREPEDPDQPGDPAPRAR